MFKNVARDNLEIENIPNKFVNLGKQMSSLNIRMKRLLVGVVTKVLQEIDELVNELLVCKQIKRTFSKLINGRFCWAGPYFFFYCSLINQQNTIKLRFNI